MKTDCPPNTAGMPEYYHEADIGTLVCWFEYEPAEPSTDSPVVCRLVNAWFGDLDIAKQLSYQVVSMIEGEAWVYFSTAKDDK